jgi:hypothetical protein
MASSNETVQAALTGSAIDILDRFQGKVRNQVGDAVLVGRDGARLLWPTLTSNNQASLGLPDILVRQGLECDCVAFTTLALRRVDAFALACCVRFPKQILASSRALDGV